MPLHQIKCTLQFDSYQTTILNVYSNIDTQKTLKTAMALYLPIYLKTELDFTLTVLSSVNEVRR